MELEDFIGKVVVATESKVRYVLTKITAPEISVRTEKTNDHGNSSYYCWETINSDPISQSYLRFEDESLYEPFKVAYGNYCRTQDAYWETYGYYMRRD